MQKTLFDKLWEQHVVKVLPDQTNVLYIDRQYIHEVTSPVAFSGLEKRGLPVLRPQQVTATPDHNVPTQNQHLPIKDALSRNQVETLHKNCERHNIDIYGLGHEWNGVVHIIGPELGLTQPGMTIVCGDSHTSTHGAFGSIAFGIGTSEIEMVLSSQCLLQRKPKTMRISINGTLGTHVTAKDIVLYIISKISASGGTGYFIEFAGTAIESLSMEGRMTICNMSIECGARGGMIAPDDKTLAYIKGRTFAPKGDEWETKCEQWLALKSDKQASFDKEYEFDAQDIEPMITYGTNPGMGMKISASIPENSDIGALKYMNFKAGEKVEGKAIDYVFLGSCTNGRIEDFRAFANFVKGKKKSDDVIAWLVPGSKQVEKQIQQEGLDKILVDAGFQIRQPGCSACLAMNEDKVPAGKYAISTSNRNFEGRQGPGARTMLAGPLVAAAAAITGRVTNPATL